jgi:DGQHR domain-containing protein
MNNSRFQFQNQRDFINAKEWMVEFLNAELKDSHKHDDPETVREEIENALQLIHSQDKKNSVAWSEIWEILQKTNEETYHHQKNPDPIYWGIWRIGLKQKLNFGYHPECIESVEIVPGGGTKIHTYKSIPPIIRWKLTKIEQKGMVFYISSAQIHEIEQVSSVPSLPEIISPQDAGTRILDSNLAPNEWQRRPNPKRIESIKEFVEIENNLIANSPILYVKESPAIEINDDILSINFNFFLDMTEEIKDGKKSKQWRDFTTSKNQSSDDSDLTDLRPIWLIDGQHRVRGLSRSQQGGELTIPIIIFPPTFGLPMAAKIFAEINTLQESLKPLHKLFMQHRFKIASPISNRNFEEWENISKFNKDSRANHLCYELIAKLASRPESALFAKAKLLDQNLEDFYVKADQWVNFSRSWFLSGPYDTITQWPKSREEDIFQEVNNYFTAFISTVNHNGWRDKKERWTDTQRNKSILQSSTHFKVLIDLFSEVHPRIKRSGNIITKDEFMKILVPFKWVDWTSKELKAAFGGGGEKGRTSLFIWMSDALKTKVSHPLKDVMSKTIRSEAGKGILAPPAKSTIDYKGTWPTKNKSILLSSPRPINARRKPEWIVMDNQGETYDVLKIRSNGEAELPYFDGIDKLKYLQISIQWANASSIIATTTIKLTNN